MTSLRALLIAMAGYYLFGKFGLALAIPPGFASAVWPASGLALACALLMRPLFSIPGIGLGSFLLNLGIATNGYDHFYPEAFSTALFIASGAMAQTAFGCYLYYQHLGRMAHLDTPKEVGIFTLVVGPGSCLIAATVGVTTLWQFDLISGENFAFTWLTWWVGDTIGVLLFTPLLLSLFSPHRQLTRIRRAQIALPTTLIFTAVLLLFFTSTDLRTEALKQEVRESSESFFIQVQERLRRSQSKLQAYVAYYGGSEFVSRDEFNLFSSLLLADDNVMQGVGWTEQISHAQRESWESSIRDSGFPYFSFTEIGADGSLVKAPAREQYYPVLYIYPLNTNARAFGLNLGASPERLAALKKARESHQPTATEPIMLAQETTQQRALVLYVPIYEPLPQGGARPESFDIAPEDAPFKGFISGIFRLSGMLGDVLTQAEKGGFAMSITDITDPTRPLPLIDAKQPALKHFDPVQKQLAFGQRIYALEFYATRAFNVASKDWNSWTILTSGFLIAAILQSLILVITGRTASIQQEVMHKTRDLHEAKQQAEAANQAKTNFLANMSHEIRTPLNAILGFINLCLKSPLTERQEGYLKNAELASETLLGLINHTLDYYKIEAGKMTLETQPFEFIKLLQKIEAIFSIQATQKGIGFSMLSPSILPDKLVGDALRLEQVLLNLCGNAVKFTQAGDVSLQVQCEPHSLGKITVTFLITDSGIGIPQAMQAHLFEPFRQADDSTSRKFGGSGLGLAICKQLVAKMDGDITIIQSNNQGSQFKVCLRLSSDEHTEWQPYRPIERSTDNHDSLAEERTSPAAITETDDHQTMTNKLAGRHILLVEDVMLNQIIAQELLENHGAEITIANNGREAVDMLAHPDQTFDLVLMDIQMPEMDGYEATIAIREQLGLKALPIVAMTANAMATDIEKSLATGMNEHIAKPINEKEMLDKITSLLDNVSASSSG